MTGSRTRTILLLLLALLLLAAAILLIRAVRPGDGEGPLRVTGIVDGIEVNLSSKVAGRVLRIPFSEGDRVKAGEAAAVLEATDLAAAVAQAQAAVSRARADVSVADAAVRTARANRESAASDAKEAAAGEAGAKEQMEEAGREAERRKGLFAKNLIAREARDQAVSAAGVSASAREAATERLASARAKLSAASAGEKEAAGRRDLAAAALAEAEAGLVFARSKLADTTIVAPAAGTVVFKAVEAGETVAPGTTILTLVDLSRLYARIDVDETKVGGVRLGGEAEISVEGIPGKTFRGRVTEIGRRGEFATQRDVIRGREDLRTFRVKVAFDDPSGALKPGMTVEVALLPARR